MDSKLVASAAISGLVGWGIHWLQQRARARITKEQQGILSHFDAAEVRAKARQSNQKPNFFLDQTKRASLLPGNAAVYPEGWERVAPLTPRRVEAAQRASAKSLQHVSPDLETDFEHEFHGSVLSVGDMQIVGNLTKGRHLFEVVQDQAYIDGAPQKLSQEAFEYVKRTLRVSG